MEARPREELQSYVRKEDVSAETAIRRGTMLQSAQNPVDHGAGIKSMVVQLLRTVSKGTISKILLEGNDPGTVLTTVHRLAV